MHVLNPLPFPVLSAVAVVAYAPYKHFPSFLEISTIALFQLHFGKGEVHYKEVPNETVSGELCARGGCQLCGRGGSAYYIQCHPK